MIKLFKTYNKAKNVFVKPKLKVYFGLWKNTPGLPVWRDYNFWSFHIFNLDVIYKWKYDTIRYEYPPQFTIVLFGIALTIFAIPQLEDDLDMPDHYWESLLSYLYQDECDRDIKKTLKFCGRWTSYRKDEENVKFFQLRKTHLKSEYHQIYDEAVIEYNQELTNKINDSL